MLPGGGDYQLLGSTTALDARYVLSSIGGEVIRGKKLYTARRPR
ncbi:hypothetical protein [Sorangium sp. So ce854]